MTGSSLGNKWLKWFTIPLIFLLSGILSMGCLPSQKTQEPPGDEDSQTLGEQITVYFARMNQASVEMVPVERSVSLEEDTPESRLGKAIEVLLEGPTDEEESQGLTSEAEGAAKLLNVEVARPYAILDFSSDLDSMGGSARVDGFLKQLAFTASEIDGVQGVVLKVEGEPRGTEDSPFTGEGVLFDSLHRPLEKEWLESLSPEDVLGLFIVVIPDTDLMWQLMGPVSQAAYKRPTGIEWSAYAEGLGNWVNYEVLEKSVDGDTARVTIGGMQVLEGMAEDARYNAFLVKVDGVWRWDFPPE